MTSTTILDSLREAINQKPPFCTGTIPLAGDTGLFFYKQENKADWLDLARASDAQLQALADACDLATFGLGQRDVLDESYRKAGKMDASNFLMKFDITKMKVIDYVREQLLDGADQDKNIRPELYKMNVYGKGSFFKSHKDTPRGETMFASLVVVFPTPHEGGALVLRHGDQEWTFDSAALTREQAEPSIAYIAFYSDVDHEVSLVTAGYRVTVTYNLFFEDKDAGNTSLPVTPVAPDDAAFRTALSAALANPEFLPKGGYLGFGLSFKYPVSHEKNKALNAAVLKGSDAVIHRVCADQLSLKTTLSAVYSVAQEETDESIKVLVPAQCLLANTYIDDDRDDDLIGVLRESCNGQIIHEFGKKAPRHSYSKRKYSNTIHLVWITPLTNYSHFGSEYLAYYGNDPGSDCVYGDLCLAVNVGPPGSRETAGQGGRPKVHMYRNYGGAGYMEDDSDSSEENEGEGEGEGVVG
ncbi:hypothetical protein H0H81_004971 [Sphagnurus paluster]|uniref:Prolyl 4-hydroxylase alpha subunit Fe(2+) 2OG dioxygenase domain-containing protein n=1 Tax=Sphagnurus paluster TaxID=117069 RepID=A0A9P7FU75_9AGAR|nr:hypothetical protein H0H81_004971 [Sphagnurus paluster]